MYSLVVSHLETEYIQTAKGLPGQHALAANSVLRARPQPLLEQNLVGILRFLKTVGRGTRKIRHETSVSNVLGFAK